MLKGAFEVILFNLVETIHVELPHKTIDLVMPEVVR